MSTSELAAPTPNEAAQSFKKIEIDLSDLDLPRKTSAAEILLNILVNYKAKVLIMLSFSDQFEILRDFKNIAHRIFKEEENDEVAIEKTGKELAKLRYIVTHQPITIIMLYTGKETAVAYVEPRE